MLVVVRCVRRFGCIWGLGGLPAVLWGQRALLVRMNVASGKSASVLQERTRVRIASCAAQLPLRCLDSTSGEQRQAEQEML